MYDSTDFAHALDNARISHGPLMSHIVALLLFSTTCSLSSMFPIPFLCVGVLMRGHEVVHIRHGRGRGALTDYASLWFIDISCHFVVLYHVMGTRRLFSAHISRTTRCVFRCLITRLLSLFYCRQTARLGLSPFPLRYRGQAIQTGQRHYPCNYPPILFPEELQVR